MAIGEYLPLWSNNIIEELDYIVIYCSSLTIQEHINNRWGFQLSIWLYLYEIYMGNWPSGSTAMWKDRGYSLNHFITNYCVTSGDQDKRPLFLAVKVSFKNFVEK